MAASARQASVTPEPAAAAMQPAFAPAQLAQLLALLRLGSPALPIGGFSYSQGLETAIERGEAGDEAAVATWLGDCLLLNIGRFEAPIVWHLCEAVRLDRFDEAHRLHELYRASRETRELRAETTQMGYSLLKLLAELPEAQALGQWRAALDHDGPDPPPTALPLAWALAARAFDVSASQALAAYLWAWLENQVMAAIKAVPLGQQAGQRLFSRLLPTLQTIVQEAAQIEATDWSNFASGFVLTSSWHETQYSRLFRS